jgi:predicted secreted protein
MFLCLAACTAPQGKKLAMNDGLAPVASGPPVQLSTITLSNRDEIIGLHPSSTLTVKLPSSNRDGYEWRLSEIPDPTVLKLVSTAYTPGEDWTKAGEQTMVFQAVGAGDVDVKMWYGTLWASPMDSARPYHFVASVSPEEPKPTKKSKKRPKNS